MSASMVPATNRRTHGRSGEFVDWVGELSPDLAFSLLGRLLPGLAILWPILLAAGLATAMGTQAVPPAELVSMFQLAAAWLTTLLLFATAFWSALGLALGRELPLMIAEATVPTGGMFAFLGLWAGMVWNKMTLGEWWIGDARALAELTLLGTYLLLMAVRAVAWDSRHGDRVAAIIAILGASPGPLVYFAVEIFSVVTGEDAGRPVGGATGIVAESQVSGVPFLLVLAGLWAYATLAAAMRLRCVIVERAAGWP